MLKFKIRKSSNKAGYTEALFQLAVHPAVLNPSLLKNEAKEIFLLYIKAMITNNPDLLPMEQIEEGLFYRSLELIQLEEGNSPKEIHILSFSVCNYDSSMMYAVKSIIYHVEFFIIEDRELIDGPNPIKPYQLYLSFTYNDRMGWQLNQIAKIPSGGI